MAALSDYMSGTISLANGSVTVTGTGTLFEVTQFREGDTLQIQNLTAVIASVDSNTQLTLAEPWTGTTIVDGAYRARQLGDGSRVSTQAATIIELLGNGVLTNLAELGVEEGKVPVGGPTGEYELADLVQDPNGSLAKLAALQLAANKAVTTDGSGNAQLSDLGTLGRSLLALATGTNAQYVQGDGTLQAKTDLPVSDATQTALDGRVARSGDTMTGNLTLRRNEASLSLVSAGAVYGVTLQASVSDQDNFGLRIIDSGNEKLRVGGAGGTAAQVYGNLSVTGTLSKGGGTFKIDHPLFPKEKYLFHGFVEAPQYDLIYRGVSNVKGGEVDVDLDEYFNMSPGTFAALTTNAEVITLRNRTFPRTFVWSGEIKGGRFRISSDDPDTNQEVCWLVIAERADSFVRDIDPNCDRTTGKLIPEQSKVE